MGTQPTKFNTARDPSRTSISSTGIAGERHIVDGRYMPAGKGDGSEKPCHVFGAATTEYQSYTLT
jgi:hypothetical protein